MADQKMEKEQFIQCDVCDAEIPKSAALSAEGQDYTWHFCGKACYKKWEERAENTDSN